MNFSEASLNLKALITPQTLKNSVQSSPVQSNPMAQDNDNHTESQLPQVLVLRQPGCWTMLESNYSHKFNFLKAWDSPLPQDQFLAGHAGSVQALLSSSIGPPITANILGMLPSLKVIVTTSAGLDHVDLPKCRERGVVVASAPKVHTHDVADLAVGLFLDVMRKISAGDRYVRDRLWASRGEFSLVSKVITLNF